MTPLPRSFQTHTKGKLLLTGEYVVLDGAKALAIPARLGQQFKVSQENALFPGQLLWSSYDHLGKSWFEASFQLSDLSVIHSSEENTSSRLIQIFQAVQQQKPSAWEGLPGLRVRMDLEFSRHWGLGTSSTLLAAVSQWQQVNPYRLLWDTFGGSAYDIACAIASGPLIYQLSAGIPKVQPVDFRPPFVNNLYLVYSGKKQNSREGIRHYRERFQSASALPLIEKIDNLTATLLNCKDLPTFEGLIKVHESLIGEAIALRPIQQQYFSDYWGQTKSLGAWGGDFILATSIREANLTRAYFQEKGLTEIYPFTDWLLL